MKLLEETPNKRSEIGDLSPNLDIEQASVAKGRSPQQSINSGSKKREI